MARKRTLSLLRPGECFVIDQDEDVPRSDLVGAVLRPELAYRIVGGDDGRIQATSATGTLRHFDLQTEVTPIARVGFDRLCEHQRRAVDEVERNT